MNPLTRSGLDRRNPTGSSDLASLAEVLRAARLERGKTQRQVASEVGVSPGLIGQIETGRTRPSVGTLVEIAKVLGLSLDGLFHGVEEEGGQPLSALRSDGTSVAGRIARARRSAGEGPDTSPPPVAAGIEQLVAREGTREIITLDGGVTWELLTREVDHDVTFMLVNYPPGSSTNPSAHLLRHDDVEYFYILSGTLHVKIGFEETVLEAGDSMSFDSARPHGFFNRTDTPVSGLWCVKRKANH